jgi:hypothetical protein
VEKNTCNKIPLDGSTQRVWYFGARATWSLFLKENRKWHFIVSKEYEQKFLRYDNDILYQCGEKKQYDRQSILGSAIF